jgi:hypothetical protein
MNRPCWNCRGVGIAEVWGLCPVCVGARYELWLCPTCDGAGGYWVQTATVASISITTGAGWNFVPSTQNGLAYTFFNFENQSVTFGAKDQNGTPLGWDRYVQWHVTDIINDYVIYDWLTQPTITIDGLWGGRAFLVNARTANSPVNHEVEVSFAGGTYGYGVEGNPYKVRQDDNTFPYAAARRAGCSLGCLRNILYIKGKPVPTEDAIVQVLAQHGKSESDFGDENIGMSHAELEQRCNQVLQPYGLTATRQNGITRDAVRDKLNNGTVLIVGVTIAVGDINDPNNMLRQVGHVIVMRKVAENKIEVIDPGDGSRKRYTLDKALAKIEFVSNPPITGRIWEITP